jgi:hypothetical protein
MIEKLGLGKTLVSIATMKTSVKILWASQIVAWLAWAQTKQAYNILLEVARSTYNTKVPSHVVMKDQVAI